MGRTIYEQNTGDFVWKYAFGLQPSEQHRIYTEYHIGEYTTDLWSPVGDQDNYTEDEIGEGIEAGRLKKVDDYLHYKRQADIIKLKHSDIPHLKAILPDEYTITHIKAIDKAFWLGDCMECGGLIDNLYKAVCKGVPDWQFWLMINRYIEFMEEHPDIEEFIFEGET